MKIPALPFTVTDWCGLPATVHPGETGEAIWRTFTIGDLRVRHIEYTPGYLADHWCDRGHVLYVLDGELDTKLRDGRTFTLKSGMSYQVSDAAMPPTDPARQLAQSSSSLTEGEPLRHRHSCIAGSGTRSEPSG